MSEERKVVQIVLQTVADLRQAEQYRNTLNKSLEDLKKQGNAGAASAAQMKTLEDSLKRVDEALKSEAAQSLRAMEATEAITEAQKGLHQETTRSVGATDKLTAAKGAMKTATSAASGALFGLFSITTLVTTAIGIAAVKLMDWYLNLGKANEKIAESQRKMEEWKATWMGAVEITEQAIGKQEALARALHSVAEAQERIADNVEKSKKETDDELKMEQERIKSVYDLRRARIDTAVAAGKMTPEQGEAAKRALGTEERKSLFDARKAAETRKVNMLAGGAVEMKAQSEKLAGEADKVRGETEDKLLLAAKAKAYADQQQSAHKTAYEAEQKQIDEQKAKIKNADKMRDAAGSGPYGSLARMTWQGEADKAQGEINRIERERETRRRAVEEATKFALRAERDASDTQRRADDLQSASERARQKSEEYQRQSYATDSGIMREGEQFKSGERIQQEIDSELNKAGRIKQLSRERDDLTGGIERGTRERTSAVRGFMKENGRDAVNMGGEISRGMEQLGAQYLAALGQVNETIKQQQAQLRRVQDELRNLKTDIR